MFVKGTLRITAVLLILAILLLLFGYILIGSIIFLIIASILQFFRDPSRKTPDDEGVVVAPADGRFLNGKIDIIEIVKSDDHLTEQVLEKHEKGILISTYMSGLDVHVNRVPITGKIIKTQYYPGKFKLAQGDVHKENEKNLIVIESKYGKVGVVQIAGFVARRIVQYVQIGDIVHTGDRLGMIRFGSRVDLIIPYKTSKLMIHEGERPKAGETIIAKMMDEDF